MARLILEDGGERRAFRINDGRLTIGSGEGCTLKLSSPDVAEIHAELEVKGAELILRPKPGVTPPTVLGKAIHQPTRLPKSAEFRVGSAVFRLEPEEHGGTAGAAVTPGSRSATGGAGGRGAAPPPASGQRIAYSRRNVQRGIPTWMIFAIIGVVGIIIYFVADKWMSDGALQYDPGARLEAAQEAFKFGGYDRALMELDRIDPELAGAELMVRVEALRAQIAQNEQAAVVNEWNVRGSEVLQKQIKNYVDKYLQGDKVDRPRARLFLKRCDSFRELYPQHPELDWVARYRGRFESIAEMSDPSTLADVDWEVTRLTAAKPRDYVLVFQLLDDFLSKAGGADRDAALAILDTQVAERELFFEDQMKQSRWHWERKDYGKSVAVLVNLITMIGDDEMQKQAAEAFVRMRAHTGEETVREYLGSYKTHRPEVFKKMIAVPSIREAAERVGML